MGARNLTHNGAIKEVFKAEDSAKAKNKEAKPKVKAIKVKRVNVAGDLTNQFEVQKVRNRFQRTCMTSMVPINSAMAKNSILTMN